MYLYVYQEDGPKVSPSATVFRIAVPMESIVSKTLTFPHQLGTEAPDKVIARKMMIVEIRSPQSKAAAVRKL